MGVTRSPRRRPRTLFAPARAMLAGWAAAATAGAVVVVVAVGVAVAAAASAVVVSPVTAAPSSATSASELVQVVGAVPPSPALFGAKLLGAASASAPLNLQIYFRPTDGAGLEALAAAVSTPGTASYHHFLTVSQFAARFGPNQATVAALDRYLRKEGLFVGPLAANRLAQDVTGSVGRIEQAFSTPLSKLRTSTGQDAVGSVLAPKLPAGLASSVSYVEGLYPWVSQSNDLVRFPSHRLIGQQTGDSCGSMATTGLSPAQLQDIYGLSGFYNNGDQGQGQTIGLIEYALADPHAVTAFEACTGASLTIDYVPASSPPRQTDAEVAADIEVIAALAPKATVVVYESSQAGTGLGPWELAVSGSAAGGLPEVITSSWGSCEPDTGLGYSYYQAEETIYDEAATQGQTILVAAGDDGSEGCLGQTHSQELAVDDPASTPGVTAVGGTASDTPNGPQYIWNSRTADARNCLGTGCPGSGAGGGGASTVWARPSYQPASLAQSPNCKLGLQGCREVPDVSALAGDPYAQFCSDSNCGSGSGWVGFGGTSLAAPSWGAAVLLSAQYCQSKIGFLNPLLYSEPSALTGPISSGNNDLSGTNFGLYQASASGGYSMAGGLGYLGGANLSSGALCGPNGASGNGGATSPPATTPSTVTSTTAPAGPASTTPTTPTTTVLPSAGDCPKPSNEAVQGKPVALGATEDASQCAGYWVVTQSGDVAAFGSATDYGSLQGTHLKAPIVGIAATPGYGGYWLLASDGGVFAFGDAKFYGSVGGTRLSEPVVGIAATPDGRGYWLVGKDGGVFAFGDAKFYGSMGGTRLNEPVVGIAATHTGDGYWLVSSDGGVFGFGDATYHGSMGNADLDSPIVGITAGLGGTGYRVVSADGNIFSFGATFYGSFGADRPPAPITAITPSVGGRGYYLLGASGDVYAYGDAEYLGNATN